MQIEDIFRNITTNYADNVNSSLCLAFNSSDCNDVINISFKLLVPSDVPARSNLADTWTATASL